MTRRAGAWIAALCLSSISQAGCGDALSSLGAVQRSQPVRYGMRVVPDFARRGQTAAFQLELDAALQEQLLGSPAYPSEIQFGPGTSLRSFDTQGDGLLEAQVLISPLADEGERQPLLVFTLDDATLEAQGSFWVLPALPGID
jgi:hypothetical protein